MQESLRHTSTSVPHFLHTLPGLSLLVRDPAASRQGTPATTGPWGATPLTCSSIQGNSPCHAVVMLYSWSEHSQPAEKKNLSLLIFLLINPMVNPEKTAKITPRHPSTVPECGWGSTITKSTAGSPRRTNFMGIRPRHVMGLLQKRPRPALLWPNARHRGADDTWSGWEPSTVTPEPA